MNTIIWTRPNMNQMFMLLFTLNMLDAATTSHLVDMGGVDVEVNPFMKWVIIHYGTIGMVLIKTAFIGFFYATYLYSMRHAPTNTLNSIRIGLIITCVIYTLLCIHNVGLMGIVLHTVG